MSDDVVRQLVSIAALRVEGVHALAREPRSGIHLAHRARTGAVGAGSVCIDIAGQQVVVGVALVAVDGVALPVVAENVRREVATAVSRMTQLRVIQVDVLIADIDLEVLEEQS
ncbi:Asp23/Gls24 family envelope stress response protein [Quadrisphaera sp. INWT6]|uniref:Asp23/Gls24 family envelope stress response protein n=1 Tax=Quadrisphaera sp. INWT6 TaxID=2596917 RepID=UPI0018923908|nr:Asp23/Gls24 family envelope stress response protein [Quadrisphaera sp. INWT6]MBF5083454.1 Asp23/Gls24 family envelope stress response protein [Quadrisphaera sp. INWT6]